MGRCVDIKAKSGQRTLLASVITSSPGPIVVGLGLLMGGSSTQLSDFIRRSSELIAIIVSWVVYRITHKDETESKAYKAGLERIAKLCVGLAMCLGGASMLLVSFLSFGGDKGNVIPGLAIAVLGVIANTWFWLRYKKLNSETPNEILAAQVRLYRAKSLVDICVTIALAAIVASPESIVALYMDAAGSIIVSVYLFVTGAMTVWGK